MSLAVSALIYGLRPDLTRNGAFLFRDEAANLFVANALNAGARLYETVAYPYGPVPIHFYAFVARMIGNTPETYLACMAAFSAISVGLAAWMIRFVGGRAAVMLLVPLGLAATMPLPGANIGGYTSSIYMPLERLALLVSFLLWRWPAERSLGRSVATGAALGACQALRFGSGVVGLLALVVLDLCRWRWRPPGSVVHSAVPSLWLIAGFAGVEGGLIAIGLLSLPAHLATEWLWPVQMWETHTTSGARRWPPWGGWRMALTQYLMPVTLASLSVVGLGRWARDSRARHRSSGEGIFALPVFFAIAALGYFRHEHHFRQFAWMLVPAAAHAVRHLPPPGRAAIALLCLPALWPLASALRRPPSADTIRLDVPRGYHLYVTGDEAARIHFLNRSVPPGSAPVVFVPNGAGWLFAYNIQPATRHSWFYSAAVVRTLEEERFLSELLRARTLVVCEPARWKTAMPFRPQTQLAVELSFVPADQSEGCTVLRNTRK